jgi:hypothetical protein
VSAAAQRPAVFIDACVLASAIKRHLVLSLADAGLIHPRWSDMVLFETGHAHARIVSGERERDGAGEAARIVTALEAAFPEAMVPADLSAAIELPARRLPDPDDAHVIRAAKAGEAAFILTDNMKDFPRKALGPLGLYARPTAEYLGSELSRRPDETAAALLSAAERLSLTPARFRLALQRAQLGGVAKRLGL